MTSMDDKDFEYIKENRLSPLYISVHTMDPELRVKMLKNKNAAKIENQLQHLKDSRISIHAQIVLCPGYNDGRQLEYSLERLYEHTPYLESVGVVPVGLTRFREGLPEIKGVDKEKALEIIDILRPFSQRAQKEYGVNWVYAADEFFLLSGNEIPSGKYYDSFFQLENGIGIARKFLDSAKASYLRIKNDIDKSKRVYVMTSKLGSKIIDKVSKEFSLNIDTVIVENSFFGKSVTVTGLLTFQDILKKIKSLKEDIPVLIPGIIFNNDGITLDGYTEKQVEQSDGRIKIIGDKGRDLIRSFR